MEYFHFKIPAHTTRRYWAIYTIIAMSINDSNNYIYTGKVGDNRFGCNPLISRVGNHFSYNKVHSQLRNYLGKHEFEPEYFNYSIHYLAFEPYKESTHENLRCKINEAERYLNKQIQEVNLKGILLLNPLNKTQHISQKEKSKRKNSLTDNERIEIKKFINEEILLTTKNIEHLADSAVNEDGSTRET